MTHRNVLFMLFIVTVLVTLAVGSDDSHASEGKYHTVDGIDYEITGLYSVTAAIVNEEHGSNVVLPTSVIIDSVEYYVTAIGPNFAEISQFYHLFIPESVIDIGIGALSSSALTSVDVDSRNPVFFSNTHALFNRDTMTLIRYFSGLPDTIYSIPSGIFYIASHAFEYSYNLEEIRGLPSTMKVIEDNTFNCCEKLVRINHKDGENLLPAGLAQIGNLAFNECFSLTQLTLPEGIRLLGYYSLSSTGLEHLFIPASLVYIDETALYDCKSISDFSVHDMNAVYTTLDGVLFKLNNDNLNLLTLAMYPGAKLDTLYRFPSYVAGISVGAFSSNNHIETVILSDLFISVPMGSLMAMPALKKVVLPHTVLAIESFAFAGCSQLEIVEGADSVVSIGDWAFFDTSVTSIIDSPKLTRIDSDAYNSCQFLVDVTIPDTVKYLGPTVFIGCHNLTRISFGGIDTKLEAESLSVGAPEFPVDLIVRYHVGLTFPLHVTNDYTNITFDEIGARPYPWVNLIGVAVCLFIVFGLFVLFREV